MDTKRAQAYMNQVWDEIAIPALHEYIRIPAKSPSFDKDWETSGYLRKAVELLRSQVEQFGIPGLTHRLVEANGHPPVLAITVPASGNSAGNVLMYGHYDKQPEFEGWHEGLGPWKPVRKGDLLYGRGGGDDGYAVFSALSAIGTLQDQGEPHPRCLILIEGTEESGSYNLPMYMDLLAEDIGRPDLLVCLDAEAGNYDQFWRTTSLRGIIVGLLTVRVLEEGVHSGGAGGIVPSSFRILRQVLDRVEDSSTGQMAEFLGVSIPETVHQQAEKTAECLGNTIKDRYPWAGNTQPLSSDPVGLLLANSWEPSLAIVGLSGAPSVESAGNTLRPETTLKMSLRTPPTLNAAIAARSLKQLLELDPPQGATVAFEIEAAETGWAARPMASWLAHSLDQASQDWFGDTYQEIGCGGTIPFMNMLGSRFPDCQILATGVLGPNSNAHGPNEFLNLDTAKRVSGCVARVLLDAVQHVD